MGIIVSVLRDTRLGDSSNGGVSGRPSLTVVNVEGPFDPNGNRPAVILIPGPYGAPILVPAVETGDGWEPIPSDTADYAGPMFGGAHAYSSDSRWGKAVGRIVRDGLKARGWVEGPNGADTYAVPTAVAIHDRVETWATYEALSR
jgi:hypothetical protein